MIIVVVLVLISRMKNSHDDIIYDHRLPMTTVLYYTYRLTAPKPK